MKTQPTKSEDLTSGCRKHATLLPLCALEPGNLSASFMVDLTAQKPRMHYGDYTERVYAETEEGSAWLSRFFALIIQSKFGHKVGSKCVISFSVLYLNRCFPLSVKH